MVDAVVVAQETDDLEIIFKWMDKIQRMDFKKLILTKRNL